ncbi:MAG: molybdopterin-dependent oxidoreductase [Candidatus Limnocylindria bacterium]|nr:molybdopterin-dependent oxidoreductase [Candidatus Limnocylindria bacterium]
MTGWGERQAERVEQRIRIEPDGTVVALSGKIEFGQGIRTAFAQLVADELDVPIERVRVVLGDTAQVPWDMGTFGSRSVAQESPALRHAAAFARSQLVARASKALGVPVNALVTADGVVRSGAKSVSYADLVSGAPLSGVVPDDVRTKPDAERRYVGKPMPRLEARDIVTGKATYVADVRLPNMARGVIVRPPTRSAKVRSVDDAKARSMPGVVAIVRDGDVVGVVAERDDQAGAAADALEVDWITAPAPEGKTLEISMRDDGGVDEALARGSARLEAEFTLPPISNAPIGPSAAVADVRADGATIYAGTQRPFGLREEIAGLLGLDEEKVRVLPQMPSGTYGRNSAGDAAVEAALLSKHAKRPVLVQWTRAEEFAYAPTRPEAFLQVAAALDAQGRIAAWRYDEHTNVHTGRGLDARSAPMTSGRNAIPHYRIPKARVTLYVEPTPLRTASFRSLAAAENIFAIESFMDELARAAKQEPLAFRLAHVEDDRLRRVYERVAQRSGWGRNPGERRGLGIAGTIYHGTSIAEVAEVEVDPSGRVRLLRVWAAVDPGVTLNPDGVRNQIEGGIQQSASWTLLEEIRHKGGRIANSAWDTYPIATFRDAPESIDVDVMGDPTKPSTGVGEPGAVAISGAIGNAVFAATGVRVRQLPITPDRVRAASSDFA